MYKITKSDSAMGNEEGVNFIDGGRKTIKMWGDEWKRRGVRYKVCFFQTINEPHLPELDVMYHHIIRSISGNT